MGLFGNQFANVVEWEEYRDDILFWKWSNQEIKKGSRLIIRPGQDAIFLYNGKVEGIFTDEGSFDIESEIIPFFGTHTAPDDFNMCHNYSSQLSQKYGFLRTAFIFTSLLVFFSTSSAIQSTHLFKIRHLEHSPLKIKVNVPSSDNDSNSTSPPSP